MKSSIAVLALLTSFLVLNIPVRAEGDSDSPAAVYDYRTLDCSIKGNKLTTVGRYRVTIFKKRGLKYGVISISENPFLKLKKMRATIFDSEGEELFTRNKKDCEKYCGYDGVQIYSDWCHYITEFKAQSFPFSIEVEYETELKSLFFWPPVTFQKNVPVSHTSYRLSIDSNSPFRYKVYGADLTPTITHEKGRRIYEWSIDSLPALEDVDWLPPGSNEPVSIRFCPEKFKLRNYEFDGDQWSSVGQWYRNLCQGRMLEGSEIDSVYPPGQFRPVVDSLYSSIQKDIRYVAIGIGIGGWQPHSAKSTIENGYGDCKDMSNVLVSQLRLNDIRAYPVLLLTRGAGLTDTTFPNDYFNHVISVAILGKDTIWMDPTCENCPFGTLPTGDQGIPVLVVTENGGEIRTTPAADWTENATVRTTHWTIEPSLHARMTTELRATGGYAKYLRNSLRGLDRDETRRFVDRQFRGAPKKYSIKTFEIENIENLDEPLIIKITGRTRKPSRRLGGVIYFNPFLLSGLHGIERTDISERIYPLYMIYPDHSRDIITVEWDSTLAVDSISVPAADSVSYACGHFTLKSKLEEDSIMCEVEKACYVFSVDTVYFDEFEEYRQGIKKALSSHVKLFD